MGEFFNAVRVRASQRAYNCEQGFHVYACKLKTHVGHDGFDLDKP